MTELVAITGIVACVAVVGIVMIARFDFWGRMDKHGVEMEAKQPQEETTDKSKDVRRKRHENRGSS